MFPCLMESAGIFSLDIGTRNVLLWLINSQYTYWLFWGQICYYLCLWSRLTFHKLCFHDSDSYNSNSWFWGLSVIRMQHSHCGILCGSLNLMVNDAWYNLLLYSISLTWIIQPSYIWQSTSLRISLVNVAPIMLHLWCPSGVTVWALWLNLFVFFIPKLLFLNNCQLQLILALASDSHHWSAVSYLLSFPPVQNISPLAHPFMTSNYATLMYNLSADLSFSNRRWTIDITPAYDMSLHL